ncbi:MAG: pyrroline-5-carboxylate reductase [Lachnospiraceae bacterium]|jgi:pyrroline-5-carboxylate reductase|nr:pyrroline-5-carboxylate reductase [Lachnospiraceae bacterium]
MEKTISFIGMGNMALAMARGFIRLGRLTPTQICAYAPNQDKLQKNASAIGFTACQSLDRALTSSDLSILCCKPYQVEAVLKDAAPLLKGKPLLCVAAGWNYERLTPLLLPDTRFQFIMPNTPAMTGEGVLLFEERHSLAEEERREIMELFGSLGMVRELPSSLMEIGMAVTGCGPAFVDLMLEAFADAAVKYGLPRPLAYELTSQMVLGSARLQLSTGRHPGQLKDEVCSPGGTTILGVDALEKAGLRAACLEAIDAVMKGPVK